MKFAALGLLLTLSAAAPVGADSNTQCDSTIAQLTAERNAWRVQAARYRMLFEDAQRAREPYRLPWLNNRRRVMT
jgi:hypothetical protein